MALVYKCDRCGEFFDQKPDLGMFKVEVDERKRSGSSWIGFVHGDLCAKCNDALQAFMRMEADHDRH